jgi:hypothetical protein
MQQRSFTFQGQMQMSEGATDKKEIEAIILSSFPTAIKVERAKVADDKHGTDFWVTTRSGRVFSIDVKVRAKDYSVNHPEKDDVALEIWSVINTKIGWTRDTEKQTDYILWIWLDSGRWMLVPFPMLCNVFSEHWEQWSKLYQVAIQTTKNRNGFQWKSQCVFVPRKIVWVAIYDTFSGVPSAQTKRQVNTDVSLNEGIKRAKHRNYHMPSHPMDCDQYSDQEYSA